MHKRKFDDSDAERNSKRNKSNDKNDRIERQIVRNMRTYITPNMLNSKINRVKNFEALKEFVNEERYRIVLDKINIKCLFISWLDLSITNKKIPKEEGEFQWILQQLLLYKEKYAIRDLATILNKCSKAELETRTLEIYILPLIIEIINNWKKNEKMMISADISMIINGIVKLRLRLSDKSSMEACCKLCIQHFVKPEMLNTANASKVAIIVYGIGKLGLGDDDSYKACVACINEFIDSKHIMTASVNNIANIMYTISIFSTQLPGFLVIRFLDDVIKSKKLSDPKRWRLEDQRQIYQFCLSMPHLLILDIHRPILYSLKDKLQDILKNDKESSIISCPQEVDVKTQAEKDALEQGGLEQGDTPKSDPLLFSKGEKVEKIEKAESAPREKPQLENELENGKKEGVACTSSP